MDTEATTEITQTTESNAPSNEPSPEPSKPALFEEMPEETDHEDTAEQPQEQSQTETIKAEDIKLPEGYEYDSELGNSFLGLLNDEKLSRKELGQKLFELYHAQGTKMLEGMKIAEKERVKKFNEELTKEKADWLKQCESDSEYGGQKWESSQSVIDRGCRHLATEGAVKLMQAYNLNYHPEIVRMFYRAGMLAGEDKSSVTGNSSGKGTDIAMSIFGESLKEYHKRRGE